MIFLGACNMSLSSIISSLRGFKHLISFLTTLPVGSGSLSVASQYFYMVPLVGLLEGIVIAGALYIISLLKPEYIMLGALYTVFHTLLTGGLHLDGFADYSEVIWARASGSRALDILKDPRRGSFAVIAVVLNLILSFASLTILSTMLGGGFKDFIVLALILALTYTASMESMYIVLLESPVEPYEGMARMFSVEARRGLRLNIMVYIVSLAAIILSLMSMVGARKTLTVILPIVASHILLSILIARDARSRLGFANGDVAGFTYELSRVLSLLLIVVLLY